MPSWSTSGSVGALNGSGLKHLCAWWAVTRKLWLLIVKCQCLQIILKNKLELIPLTITLIYILICLCEWEQKVWRPSCFPENCVWPWAHPQGSPLWMWSGAHSGGFENFRPRRKGEHYFLTWGEATRKLSPNSICLPFSWDIGLLVAWFQNIHTCNSRKVRK